MPPLNHVDFKFLITETRARVYLLWAILVPFGFVATHYYQNKNINALWAVIALVGLGYMLRVMPMRVSQAKHIFAAWFVPIVIGMIVSAVVFYVSARWAFDVMVHLGAFWLGVMAVGYFLNGLVDPPSTWYWVIALVNALFCVLCWLVAPFEAGQYLIAAVVSAWSMLNLWFFRS